MQKQETYQVITEAANLLQDENLVWSEDFDLIRKPLAAWLTDQSYSKHPDQNALQIARLLISSETDDDGIASLSWLDEWKKN